MVDLHFLPCSPSLVRSRPGVSILLSTAINGYILYCCPTAATLLAQRSGNRRPQVEWNHKDRCLIMLLRNIIHTVRWPRRTNVAALVLRARIQFRTQIQTHTHTHKSVKRGDITIASVRSTHPPSSHGTIPHTRPSERKEKYGCRSIRCLSI